MCVALEDPALLSVVLDSLELYLEDWRKVDERDRSSGQFAFDLDWGVVKHCVEAIIEITVERSRRNIDEERREGLVLCSDWLRG